MRAPDGTPAMQEELRLSPEQVGALMHYGTELGLQTGSLLFDETATVDSFYVVLEGEVIISRLDGADEIPLGAHQTGEFTGGLAVLTGKTSIHRARAAGPGRVLEIDSETFRRVAVELPEVADVLISGLTRRMRYTQRAFRQQEKLAALGKLSAGLTHELNNPAAAARRASEELGSAISTAQRAALEHDGRFSPGERQALLALQGESAAGALPRDPLLLSDAEEELAAWLDEHEVEESWDFAATLAAAGLEAGSLEQLAGVLEAGSLAAGGGWLSKTIELIGLADEVATSSRRISELVGAMKDYTYMDRAAVDDVDVTAGLDNTLTILGHKLKGVSVRREYEENLPRVRGNGGELNQVWTNLIDNAADALDGRGNITLRVYAREGKVMVEVADDGPGIPREAQGHVFEPFYTTREVGAGTGLGLNVVRRTVVAHGGSIAVRSEPGETRFTVGLPVVG
ncbi:MAG TPA: ATP-binding protein, partial [Rubrobacter sp.]|nr:ATP-binding protein [Rubrobacter sp.]